MKNLKIFALVLTLALLITAAVCTTVFAQEEPEAPVIASKNLSYEDNTHLYYAVKVTANVTAANTTLNIYADASCENALATGIVGNTETLSALGGGEYIVFRAPGIAAKHITREVYAQAVTAEGGKSELCKYSVAEYLLERLYVSERLGKTVTEEQKALYESYLVYGANAQTLFTNSKIENPADKEVLATALNIARVIDGTFADGTNQKLFAAGSGATVVATPADPSVAVWQVTSIDAAGTVSQSKTANTTDAITIAGQTIITAPQVAPALKFDSADDLQYFSFDTTFLVDGRIESETTPTQANQAFEIADGKLVFDSPLAHNNILHIGRTGNAIGNNKAVFEADITYDVTKTNNSETYGGAQWLAFNFYDPTTGTSYGAFYIMLGDGDTSATVSQNSTQAATTMDYFKDGVEFSLKLEYVINPSGYNNVYVYLKDAETGKFPEYTGTGLTWRTTWNASTNGCNPDNIALKIEIARYQDITLTLDNVRFDGE